MFKKFLRDECASFSITTAIVAVPLLMATGAGVDYSLAMLDVARAQAALDAATLAGGRQIGLIQNSAIQTLAINYFNSTFVPKASTTYTLGTPTILNGEITMTASVSTKMFFAQITGVGTLNRDLVSKVDIGIANFDVAIVLDNSGSMAGSKITTQKTAAKNLVDTLMVMNTTDATHPNRMQIGLVPFSASVNVGASFGPTYNSSLVRTATGASWLDYDALSPIHRENFVAGSTDNRFALFAGLAKAYPTYASALNWGGCVEVRPQPYDVEYRAPAQSDPSSLFVPMFAPDEPGYRSGSRLNWTVPSGFDNNYIDDNGGTCTAGSASTGTNAGKLEAENRTCKYKTPTTAQFYDPSNMDGYYGPNYACTTRPITRMSRNATTLKTEIGNLSATGNTNILEGLMWGWRTLSHLAPFGDGRVATAEEPLYKIIILMTDGENFISAQSNINASVYSAFGYVSDNRLGITSGTQAQIQAKQDARTALACTNAKADGVIVYTIAFEVTATATQDMLRTCATGSSYFYNAADNAALLAAFAQIAKQISQLRIAQ